jgi:hypothetical protein
VRMTVSWRRSLSAFLLATSSIGALGAEPSPPSNPAGLSDLAIPGTGRLEGRVLRSDGKTPVSNAVVRACYLEGERVLASAPTGSRGQYQLGSLPPGYADLLVETPEGVFLANQVVQFHPDKKLLMNFVLAKFSEHPASWGAQKKRETPCASASQAGAAQIEEKSVAGGFVRSPKGIALLAGLGGAALLLAVSGGGSSESPASAFVP